MYAHLSAVTDTAMRRDLSFIQVRGNRLKAIGERALYPTMVLSGLFICMAFLSQFLTFIFNAVISCSHSFPLKGYASHQRASRAALNVQFVVADLQRKSRPSLSAFGTRDPQIVHFAEPILFPSGLPRGEFIGVHWYKKNQNIIRKFNEFWHEHVISVTHMQKKKNPKTSELLTK